MIKNLQDKESILVISLKEGDISAYSLLYDQFGSLLYGFIIQVVNDDETADDIFKEVFIKIYENIDQYDEAKCKLYTWIIQLTRTIAKEKIKDENYDTEKASPFSDSRKGQDKEKNKAKLRKMINIQAITKVINTDENHKIIDLAYFYGLSQEEIAEKLDIPVVTVNIKLREAFIHLAKQFCEKGKHNVGG